MLALKLLLAHVLATGVVAPQQAVTIPVTLRSGYIYVPVQVNGRKATFLLDTGAGLDCLTPDFASKLGLTKGIKITANGAGSKSVQASIVQVKDLRIGTAFLTDSPAAIVPLPKDLQCDGLIGYNFVNAFVMTVDYDKKTVTFCPRSAFESDPETTEVPLKIIDNHPAAEGSIEGIEGWLILDTGAGNSLSAFSPFVEEHRLREKFPHSTSTITGWGVGGFTYGDFVRMETVKFGPFELPPMIAELSSQTKGAMAAKQGIAIVGSELLSRFRLTFDYSGKKLYLRKSDRFGEAREGGRSGIISEFDGHLHRVTSVIANTPAEEAGIKAGDVLLEIDGVSVVKLHPMDVRARLRAKPGTSIRLRLKRDVSEYEVNLVTQELVPK